MTAIPIEEAVAILSRVPAEVSSLEEHVRIARALDVLAARGLPVVPERFVVRAASSDVSLLDFLIALLAESERTAQAVISRARTLAEQSGLPAEAANAHAARRILLDPGSAIARDLPREVVVQNDFRREELVRTWAARLEIPVESRGKPEEPERSARVLERLDYRRIRADEDRLAIERKVLAEHAAAVREKQRIEAEALASAQRE